MALSTPLYKLDQYPDVYEPSEDTHLLLDALEKEIHYIVNKRPLLACEIGSGSGILISALANILQSSCLCFSTDINISACQATQSTSRLNSVNVETVGMNLTSMFQCQFDLILFNPPYVVTKSEEVRGNGLNRAYAGGTYGREIIDSFITILPNILSAQGVCYLLLLKENKVEEVLVNVKNHGFNNKIVLERKIPGEHLFVYKFFK